ncbi:hypothetical protein C8N32_1181, partial [Rhodovulum imhoffii]
HGVDVLLQFICTGGQIGDLLYQAAADFPNSGWYVRGFIRDDFFYPARVMDAVWGDIAELIKMRAQRIHQFGALVNQLLAGTKDDGALLLRFGLLTSTKRIVGRVAASTMASASLASFLWRLTNGLT